MWNSRVQKRWIVLLILILLVALVGLTRQGRTALTTALLLPHLFPNAPARPLDWFTPAPVVKQVSYDSVEGVIPADLYRPNDGAKHPAFILMLGVFPVERNQPELVEFCNGLARAGYVVLVHDPPELRKGHINPQEKDGLVTAFQYLQSQPFVDPQRIGFLGFSVGASLATVAAEDERINNQVAVVNFFGGYYDILDVLRAVATHQIVYKGERQSWEPSDLTVLVFTNQLIESVDDPHDHDLVYKALVNKQDLSTTEYESLGSTAKLIYDLFRTHDPGKVDQLIKQIPAPMMERLKAVSPDTNIANLKTRMMIMHDVDDHYITYFESRKLRDALPPSQSHYTEFSIFAHVMVNTNSNPLMLVSEGSKLFYHVYLLLLTLS